MFLKPQARVVGNRWWTYDATHPCGVATGPWYVGPADSSDFANPRLSCFFLTWVDGQRLQWNWCFENFTSVSIISLASRQVHGRSPRILGVLLPVLHSSFHYLLGWVETCSHIKCESPNDCDFLWTQKQFWRCSTDFHSPFSHIATVDLFLSGKGVLKNVELQLILWNETSVFTAFYSWFCVVRSFFHSARRSGGVSSWWS